jgi:hypothetical protein
LLRAGLAIQPLHGAPKELVERRFGPVWIGGRSSWGELRDNIGQRVERDRA